MFNKILVSFLFFMVSNVGFSLITKEEWVHKCHNSQGNEKKSFYELRLLVEYIDDDNLWWTAKQSDYQSYSPATCSAAYDKIVSRESIITPVWVNLPDLTPLEGLTNLETLHIETSQISDLTPLEGLTNLKSFILGSTHKNIDLSPLSRLNKLEKIGLCGCQLSDLSPLSRLNKLESLGLLGGQLSDLTQIADFRNLTVLGLDSNEISDLSPLARLTNLEELYLNDNQISDLSPLARLTNLQLLNLNDNKISDLHPLAGLENLKYLYAKHNKIKDISPLAGITNLEELKFSKNKISDLGPLFRLRNLTVLDLRDNEIFKLNTLSRLSLLKTVDVRENYISDFSPVNHVSKILDTGFQKRISNFKTPLVPELAGNSFYKNLVQENPNISDLFDKLDKLPTLIEDVHQMKFFYSFVMYYYRTGTIFLHEGNEFIIKGLNKTASTVVSAKGMAIYKAIIRKALKDRIIDIEKFDELESIAQDRKTSKMPFIKDLQRSVQENTAAIKGLEGDIQTLQKNIATVNQSLNSLKKGLHLKMKIEAGVSFAGAMLNAASLGIGGSFLQAFALTTMPEIVDLSDFAHLKEIAVKNGHGEIFSQLEEFAGDTDIADVIGWKISAVGLTSHMKLQKALHEENPLVMIAAIAAKIEQVKNKKPSISFANSTNIEVDEDDNGISDDEDDDNGFSDDEEETVFELIDAGNLDGLAEYLNQFETKEDLNRAFKNEVKEKNENSLKYAIRVKNTDAVRIIGEKAVSLDIIPKKKLDKYITGI